MNLRHAGAVDLRRAAAPWLGAVGLHAVVMLALAAGMFVEAPPPPLPTLGIEAVVVDEQLIAASRTQRREAARRQQLQRQADEARQQQAEKLAREAQERQAAERQQKLELTRQREAAAATARDQAAAAAKARAAATSKARADAAARARAEAAAKAQAAADARRVAQREGDLKARLAAEESQRAGDAARATLRQQYAALIRDRVERNWRRPPGVQPGLSCTLLVGQIPGGEVTSVNVGACTADAAVRQSIIDAVYRASPLPPPPEPALFERNLVLVFTPQE